MQQENGEKSEQLAGIEGIMMAGRGRPTTRANSIKQFICRSEAPPEGTSHSRRRFSPRPRPCVPVQVCADMEERTWAGEGPNLPTRSRGSRSLALQYNAPNVTAPVST